MYNFIGENMKTRKNENKREKFTFKADEIILAIKMLEVLEKPLEMMYYLMEEKCSNEFVLLLISAENLNIKTIFEAQKRDTDILFEIDKEKSLYVILCQDTKVDGGYHFAERLIKKLFLKKGKEIYCAELAVRSLNYSVKKLIFKLIKTFLEAQVDGKKNHIIYKSLS